MSSKKKCNIVISINVHEKPDYLMDQLDNINEYVKFQKFIIILNCNDFMHHQLISKREELSAKNTIINPFPLNKRRFHGSLTQGIISNMKYALENFDFDFFLVMSSREFFYQKLHDYEQILENATECYGKNYNTNEWHWPRMKNTKLFQYIVNNNLYFSCSAHEGLCLDVECCVNVNKFLIEHPDIESDLYNFNHCVEEFAIQSICDNYGRYYYIGNGVENTSPDKANKKKFTLKTPR